MVYHNLAIDNNSGGTLLYRSPSLTPLGATGIFGPVDVKVSSDNKKVGVAGVSATSTLYPPVCVWYNE
jgi:hypothetical protein